MNAKQYHEKNTTIEAMHWNGCKDSGQEIAAWVRSYCGDDSAFWFENPPFISLRTPSGIVRVKPGDYVVREGATTFYQCRPEIFEDKYDKGENND